MQEKPKDVTPCGATGLVFPFRIDEVTQAQLFRGLAEHNLVLYGGATIAAQLLRGQPDGKPWKIGAMYLEYENNGGVAVSPPSFDRSDGRDYYDDLGLSSNRDYLRVPLTGQTLDSSNETLYPDGNRVTFIAQTSGVEGANGKEFSHLVQSRIFGGALVATPVFSDPTQDVVYSRFYFSDTDNQLIKLAGSQIGLTWQIIHA